MHRKFVPLFMVIIICLGALGSFSSTSAAAQVPSEPLVALHTLEQELLLSSLTQPVTTEPALPDANIFSPIGEKRGTWDALTPIDLESLVSFPESDFLARGVIITPTALTSEGAPGEEVVYLMYVGNRGSEIDTFDIDMSSGWLATISADTIGPLDPGENAPLTLTVTVPVHGLPGDFDTAQVVATSQADPTKTATATRITFVEWQAVEVAPLEAVVYGNPGQTIPYTYTVTNISEITSTFTVTMTSDWESSAPPIIGPLVPGESGLLSVEVTIPLDAVSGDSTTATITVVSALPGAMDAVATLTVNARTDHGLDVSVEQDTLVANKPGVTVGYTLYLTNTGELTDTYDLSVSSTWGVSYPLTIGPLESGESATVVVLVTVPDNVDNGDIHVATATFSSQADPSITEDVDLTTLIIWYNLYLPMTIKN